MRTLVLTMKVLPPTLNDIIALARRNKFASATEKKLWTLNIAAAARNARVPHFQGKLYLEYVWRVKNFRRDQDNITSSQKYILDGLVTGNVIDEDNVGLIQSPVVHWFEKADHDGFSIVIRDAEAWKARSGEFAMFDGEAAAPVIYEVDEIFLELPKNTVRKRSSSASLPKATTRRPKAKRAKTRAASRRTITRLKYQ